jgi:glycosyltransferase involved in cell wall biosynthesis
MNKINSVIFWQPNVSHHTVPVMRELASYYTVTLCVIERMSERRKAMGWSEPDTTGIKVDIVSAENPELFFEAHHGDSTVHIFSGTSGYRLLWRAFKKGLRLKAKLGFQAETRNWQGPSGLLRVAHSRWEALLIRNGVSFILAIGDRGVEWYSRVGYQSSGIFNWAYFTNRYDHPTVLQQKSTKIRIAYAGRFSPEKGIVSLIEMINSIPDSNIQLHIAGGGPQQSQVEALIAGCTNITWHGMLPMNAVTFLLTEMDYLIVPSKGKDGWAAVVNEALNVGTPCIVSRNAGAASLIVNDRLGFTYDPSQENALLDLLKMISKEQMVPDATQREWIRQHAEKIYPQAGAVYLREIIENVFLGSKRPEAPWKLISQH